MSVKPAGADCKNC